MPQWTAEVIDGRISRELRRSVLRPHYAVDAVLPGDDLAAAVHLGVFAGTDAGRVLASTCMIFPQRCSWLPEAIGWQLRSMATDPNWRGTGAGTEILRAARAFATAAGATVLWCNARVPAIEFYRRNGFLEHGELFDAEGGPHRRMWLPLSD
jgi:GNAT superfamily N-acetyltransferase